MDWQLAQPVDPVAPKLGFAPSRTPSQRGRKSLARMEIDSRSRDVSDMDSPSTSDNGIGVNRRKMSSVEEMHARFLGRRLHFRDPSIYYMAVILDLLLRFTWSLKLSTHLRLEELTVGGFAMEWLEIVRRWLWVFFRLEREWVEKGYGLLGSVERGQDERVDEEQAESTGHDRNTAEELRERNIAGIASRVIAD